MDHNSTDGNDALLHGLTLLLADDEVRLRQIVVLMAEELGAEVIAVDNCEDAVALYQKRGSEISVVMLDVRMSGMGGKTAFRHIMEIDPEARVVLSSGIRPSEDLIKELHDNSCDFIEKPFDMDQLGMVLSSVARKPKSPL